MICVHHRPEFREDAGHAPGYLVRKSMRFASQRFAPVGAIIVPRGSAMLIDEVAAQAAARLNLTRGRDNIWRGRCPVCGYAKPSLELAVEQDRIAVACSACGADASVARMIGLPSELVVVRGARQWKIVDPKTQVQFQSGADNMTKHPRSVTWHTALACKPPRNCSARIAVLTTIARPSPPSRPRCSVASRSVCRSNAGCDDGCYPTAPPSPTRFPRS